MIRIFLCFAVLLASPSAFAAVVDGIIAIVGTDVILKSEVEELKQQLMMPGMSEAVYGEGVTSKPTDEDVLNMLIEDKLIEEAIREIGVEISEDDVESTITQIAKKNNVPKAQLIEMLKREGMSYDHYKDNIRSRLKKDRFRGQFITPYVTVTDEQVRRFMEKEFPQMSLYDTTFVILDKSEVSAWKGLKSSKARVKKMKGYTFKSAPTPYTGYSDEFAPEVARVLKGKKVGYVSPVVKIGDQRVLVKIDAIRKGHVEDTPQYKEKFAKAKGRLLQKSYKKYMKQWVKKRKFEVDIQLIELPKS